MIARVAIALAAGLLVIITALLNEPAFAHPTGTCLSSRWVGIDEVQFDRQTITVGETVRITGKLRSVVDEPMSLVLIPIADDGRYEADGCSSPAGKYTQEMVKDTGWQIANMSAPINGFVLQAKETMPFSIELKSTKAGTFHLHAASAVSILTDEQRTIEGIYVTRGATIIVNPAAEQTPSLTTPYIIGIGAAIAGIIAFLTMRKRKK